MIAARSSSISRTSSWANIAFTSSSSASSNTRVIDMMLSDTLIKLPTFCVMAFATFSIVFLLFSAETLATSVLTLIVLPASINAIGFSGTS